MYQIDVAIINKALEAPGRISRRQEDLVCKIDRLRKGNPFTRLRKWERQELKVIGRIFEIYPETFNHPEAGRPVQHVRQH